MKNSVLFLFIITFLIFISYNIFAQDVSVSTDTKSESTKIRTMRGNLLAQNPKKPDAENRPLGMMGRGPMRNMDQGLGRMMGREPMAFAFDFADKIGLSDEQKKKIDEIMTNHKKDMIKKNAEIALAELDFNKLMREENPDINLVKEHIQKISALKADREFVRIKAMFDLKNVLTKEQQEKLNEIRKEHRENMKDNAKEKMKDLRGIKQSDRLKMEKSKK